MRRLAALFAMAFWACGSEPTPRSVGALQDQCSKCHPKQHEALRSSAHGRAMRSEVFLALRDVAIEKLGDPPLCDRCHSPEHGTKDGLSCVSCHAAVGNFGTENGKLALDLDGPVRGLRSAIDARAPHDVEASSFLSSADLCGTCHEVDGPGAFDERPYSHWRDSPAAKAGVGCIECHLGPIPGTPDGEWPTGPVANLPDLVARPLADHRMLGLGADPETARALLERSSRIEILSANPGEIVVEIENLGLGHRLPDGASFVRELWVSIELHRDGVVLESSMFWLSARGQRGGLPVASPLEADEITEHGLSPGRSRTETWSPVDTSDATHVRACLRFRRYRPDLLESLGLADALAGPGVDVNCDELVIAD